MTIDLKAPFSDLLDEAGDGPRHGMTWTRMIFESNMWKIHCSKRFCGPTVLLKNFAGEIFWDFQNVDKPTKIHSMYILTYIMPRWKLNWNLPSGLEKENFKLLSAIWGPTFARGGALKYGSSPAGVEDRFLKKWLDYLCFVLQALQHNMTVGLRSFSRTSC